MNLSKKMDGRVKPGHDAREETAYAATAFFAVGTEAMVFRICEAIW